MQTALKAIKFFKYRHLLVALIMDRSCYATEMEQLCAVIEFILREDVVNAKIK